VEDVKIEVAVPPEEEAIPANVYGLEVPKFTYVTPGPLEVCSVIFIASIICMFIFFTHAILAGLHYSCRE
jgi:hypothetical protein